MPTSLMPIVPTLKLPKLLRASAAVDNLPAELRICGEESTLHLQAIAEGNGNSPRQKLRRFTMTAYTGGPMRLPGWPEPVVVDLAGLRVSRQSRPILKDHDRTAIVGHTDEIRTGERTLEVAGVISGTGPVAQEIITTSENGFPWQASIGARAERVVFIPSGKSARANGREFAGPLYVARRATLGEVSFVAMAADDNTTARVAATRADQPKESCNMPFEEWAAQHNVTLDDLSEDNRSALEAMYQADEPNEPPTNPESESTTTPVPDVAAEMRAAAATESRRIAAVRRLCHDHPDLEARAIEENWTETRTELEVLRASRPTGPAIRESRPSLTSMVLEAAACLSAGMVENDLVGQYGEQTVETAYPLRHIGLRELVAECARMEGHDIPRVFGDGTATIRAGFSTVSLPGILENVMNKTLLAAYQSTAVAAFDLCSVSSVSDFKEVSRYRLLGTGGFDKLAPDGELKHGKLSEQKYSAQADTYGQMLMLTRKEIINDDLNAFLEIPREMGRSGAAVIDDLFFTLLLANAGAFFSAGNNNFLSGAATAFGPDSLTDAKTLFRKQKAGPGTDPKDQKPINVRPELLVVPVELETDAELLMGAAQLMIDASGSPVKLPTDNPHRNKYRVISVPHLSDTYYGGASAKAWYLFASPSLLPAFELVFLNGRRVPVIERVEAPPNMLGMGFRGYIDVGVNSQNPRGAVKMAGE